MVTTKLTEIWMMAVVFPERLTKGTILKNIMLGTMILRQEAPLLIGNTPEPKVLSPVYATTVERYGNLFASLEGLKREGRIISYYRAVDMEFGDVALLILAESRDELVEIRAQEKTTVFR